MKDRLNRWLAPLPRSVRRALVLVIGLAVLFAGVAMLVLPGPGILVILIGLGILATEFVWAETLLRRARERASRALAKVRTSRPGRADQ
jgi:uncharacterized protein (TIGR02611 family)